MLDDAYFLFGIGKTLHYRLHNHLASSTTSTTTKTIYWYWRGGVPGYELEQGYSWGTVTISETNIIPSNPDPFPMGIPTFFSDMPIPSRLARRESPPETVGFSRIKWSKMPLWEFMSFYRNKIHILRPYWVLSVTILYLLTIIRKSFPEIDFWSIFFSCGYCKYH